MRIILHNRSLYVLGAFGLIGVALWLLISVTGGNNVDYVTTTVERGDVLEIVSVSGVVEAANTAELAFPVGGIVQTVAITEGQDVTAGEVLITQQQAGLQADRRDAVAALLSAQADRDELINGARSETRDVTASEVAIAEENLARTIAEETEKINNAEATLRTSGLEAYSTDLNDDATPPQISGAYNCTATGEYTLQPFTSGSNLGYRIVGLETGNFRAADGQSTPLGDCGLRVTFSPSDNYQNTEWRIPVPNPSGATYAINLNTVTLTKQQAQNAIEAAEQALDLALKQQTLENASPRDEALRRSNATVMQAEARLAAVDAAITDRTIIAPFSGIITNVDILPGETVTTVPVVTLLADTNFELTARIPEIDITKIATGQQVDVLFDARATEVIAGTVGFISPLAIEIDGVAYFEATILFPEVPSWMRSGLNADIDIIIDQALDAVRIPKRFLVTTPESDTYVQVYDADNPGTPMQQPVTVLFTGNDGFVAVDGITAGLEIIIE